MTNSTPCYIYLLNSFPNLSETFISDEIHCLLKQGVTIKVFSLDKPDLSTVHPNAKEILESGIVEYLDQPTPLKKLSSLLRLILINPSRLVSLLKLDVASWIKFEALGYLSKLTSTHPAHIHCHYAAHSSQIALVVNHCKDIPFSITTHGYDVFFEAPDNYDVLANYAQTIFTISNYNREYLLQHYQLNPAKLMTRYCGVDTAKFNTMAFKEINLNEPINILTVARLHPVKGHKILLKAAAELKIQYSWQLNFWFAGDGPLRNELEALAKQLNLTEHVHFLGNQSQDQVRELINNSHLFVLPSLSEGIPISLMEAMAGNTPVIGPNINGVPELIQNKKEGLLFEPGNVASLTDSICEIIKNHKQLNTITTNARLKVESVFSLEKNTLDKFSQYSNQ